MLVDRSATKHSDYIQINKLEVQWAGTFVDRSAAKHSAYLQINKLKVQWAGTFVSDT